MEEELGRVQLGLGNELKGVGYDTIAMDGVQVILACGGLVWNRTGFGITLMKQSSLGSYRTGAAAPETQGRIRQGQSPSQSCRTPGQSQHLNL